MKGSESDLKTGDLHSDESRDPVVLGSVLVVEAVRERRQPKPFGGKPVLSAYGVSPIQWANELTQNVDWMNEDRLASESLSESRMKTYVVNDQKTKGAGVEETTAPVSPAEASDETREEAEKKEQVSALVFVPPF